MEARVLLKQLQGVTVLFMSLLVALDRSYVLFVKPPAPPG